MKKIDKALLQLILICLLCVIAFLAVFKADAVIGAVGYFLAMISPITVGACIAFVLNILLSLYEKRLPKKFMDKLGRFSRVFCIFLTLFTVTAVLAVFVLLIYPELEKTISSVVANIPGYASAIIEQIAKITGSSEAEITANMNINWDSVSSTIADFIENYGDRVISGTIGVTGNVLTIVLKLCVSMIFAIWILLFKESLGRSAKRMISRFFPKNAENIHRLARFSSDMFSSFIGGQLAEALTIGSLCFVGMLIFGFPYALTASAIIMIFALVPVFGAIVGAILAALLMLTESFATAIWFLVYIIILQQLESNIIYPKLIGKTVGLPGIWVLIAVTIGGDMFGAIGMLTAVPVFAILFAIFNALLDKRIEAKKKKAAENAAATE